MDIAVCFSCKVRVVPTSKGQCPACRQFTFKVDSSWTPVLDRLNRVEFVKPDRSELKELRSNYRRRLSKSRRAELLAWFAVFCGLFAMFLAGFFYVDLLSVPIAYVIYRYARQCYRAAEALAAPDARIVLYDDRRAPILYLRSFRRDGSRPPENAWVLAFTHLLVGDLLRQMAPFRLSHEERIVRVMKKYGPVVAIGRPGEPLREIGASRMYIADEDWQRSVRLLVESSQFAIIRMDDSEGVMWEFEVLCATNRPDRIVLYLEPPRRLNELELPILPRHLSQSVPVARFVLFGEKIGHRAF